MRSDARKRQEDRAVTTALTEAINLMYGFLHDPDCESCEDVRECIAVVRSLMPEGRS